MTKRQIIVYQKSEARPVMMGDVTGVSDEELTSTLTSCFENKNITIIKSDMETLIVRPSELVSILIAKREDAPPKKKNVYTSELESDGVPK
jgi:hypothetical protein